MTTRVFLFCASGLLVALGPSACSSDATNGNPATAGSPGSSAGAAGLVAAAGAAGTNVGLAGSGGIPGAAGAAGTSAQAGAGSAGTPSGGTSGTAAGGAAGDGLGGSGGAVAGSAGMSGMSGAAGAAGGTNCAGNAISLSANGTGSASDAAQAHVLIDLMSDLPIGNAKRTVEFWAYIKSTDWVGEKNEVYFYGATGTNTTFGLDFGTNEVMGMAGNHATFNPFTNGSFTVDSTDNLGVSSTSDQWLHVAMTWDGASLKLYANGELGITKTDASMMLATTNSQFTLGCNPLNKNCFNGSFDELRIWNLDRSAAQIKANYSKSLVGNESGLVGYWKFNEAPGASSAADSVTTAGHTAHPGTLMAAAPNQKPTFVTPTKAPPISCP